MSSEYRSGLANKSLLNGRAAPKRDLALELLAAEKVA